MPAAVEAKGACKRYRIRHGREPTFKGALMDTFKRRGVRESFLALDNVSFEVEKGETLAKAMVREMEEETGLRTRVEKLFYVCDKPDVDPPVLHVTFLLRKIKGEIKVLVSQVIYSGRFLALLPLILMGLLWFANRDYLMSFFSPGNLLCGGIMLSVAGTMVIAGYIAMNKLADIEV